MLRLKLLVLFDCASVIIYRLINRARERGRDSRIPDWENKSLKQLDEAYHFLLYAKRALKRMEDKNNE